MSDHLVEKVASLSYQMGQMQMHIDGQKIQFDQQAKLAETDKAALRELQGRVTAGEAENKRLLAQLDAKN